MTAAAQAPVPVVVPEENSRLEQLAAQYDMAKAEADKAANDLKAITDAIKLEMMNAAPANADKLDLSSPLLARPLRLQAVTSWRVDATKLKAESPETYVRFAKQSTAWKLSAVGR